MSFQEQYGRLVHFIFHKVVRLIHIMPRLTTSLSKSRRASPPTQITKAEEMIQYKSEELLGQRPRLPPSMQGAGGAGRPMPMGKGDRQPPQDPSIPPVCPPGTICAEVDVPKELMGAIIGAGGSGIERIKASFAGKDLFCPRT